MAVSRDTSEDAARMSRDLLAQGIRARHPEYSDDEVKWALIRVWIGRDLFLRAYPHCPQLAP